MKRFLSLGLLALTLAFAGCDNNGEEDSIEGTAMIIGQILDSQLGEPIANALVSFARGNASIEATTDSTGTFTINGIATGRFSVTIQADGYINVTLEDIEIGEGSNMLPPLVVAEAPPAGAYRIVLSWGEAPRDLDSHLSGPDGQGGRFHVYYANRTEELADLDVDDVTSFGPETITLMPDNDGMYRYSVHNFSDQSETGSQGIAGQPENAIAARVQVYTATGLVREYRAPAAMPGNTWRVFELNASGGTASLTDVNQYVDANGSGDTDVFRLVPKTP